MRLAHRQERLTLSAMKRNPLEIILGAALALAACKGGSKSGGESSGPPPSGEAQAQAMSIMNQRCTPCHGSSGKGDGPASASLNPKPRNWTDRAWQKVTPNEEIEKAIVYGGAAVGKSAAMPANPDLQDKPQVVVALRNLVRGFAP
jgi:hypothetical protein